MFCVQGMGSQRFKPSMDSTSASFIIFPSPLRGARINRRSVSNDSGISSRIGFSMPIIGQSSAKWDKSNRQVRQEWDRKLRAERLIYFLASDTHQRVIHADRHRCADQQYKS